MKELFWYLKDMFYRLICMIVNLLLEKEMFAVVNGGGIKNTEKTEGKGNSYLENRSIFGLMLLSEPEKRIKRMQKRALSAVCMQKQDRPFRNRRIRQGRAPCRKWDHLPFSVHKF